LRKIGDGTGRVTRNISATQADWDIINRYAMDERITVSEAIRTLILVCEGIRIGAVKMIPELNKVFDAMQAIRAEQETKEKK